LNVGHGLAPGAALAFFEAVEVQAAGDPANAVDGAKASAGLGVGQGLFSSRPACRAGQHPELTHPQAAALAGSAAPVLTATACAKRHKSVSAACNKSRIWTSPVKGAQPLSLSRSAASGCARLRPLDVLAVRIIAVAP
jgi:hypothetical protein